MPSKKYVQPYKNQFIMDKNDTIIYQDFLNKLNRSTEGTIEALKSSNTQTDNNVYYIFSNTLNEINLIIGNYDIDVALRGDITKIDDKNRLKGIIKNRTEEIINEYNATFTELAKYNIDLRDLEEENLDKKKIAYNHLRKNYANAFSDKQFYNPNTFSTITARDNLDSTDAIINKTIENINNIDNDKNLIIESAINRNNDIRNINYQIKQLKDEEMETTGMSSQSNEILVLNNLKKNNNDLLKKIGELKTLFDKNKDNIKSLDKVNHSNLNKDLKHTNKLINDIQLLRETNNVLIMINDKINKIKDKWTELYNQFNGYLKLQTDYIGGLIIKSPIDKLLLSHIFPKSYLNNKMKYKL